MRKVVLSLLSLSAAFCTSIGCASTKHALSGTKNEPSLVTPTHLVDSSKIQFEDDLDFSQLSIAIERQIKAYADGRVPLNGSIQFGSDIFPKSILKDTLIEFRALAEGAANCIRNTSRKDCIASFRTSVRDQYLVYSPNQSESFFTAYYSPEYEGSLTPSPKYALPLYKKPDSAGLTSLTRSQIIFDERLKGKNLEIAYLDASLFDLYMLQVQGGGRVDLIDERQQKQVKYISYAGNNGKKLKFLAKILMEMGLITEADHSFEAQSAVLVAHPELLRTIFDQTPSYVYFTLSTDEPAGVDGIPLTENRSLAIDLKHYPVSGVLNFIEAAEKITSPQGPALAPFSRFFLAQDTGSAITGIARSDLYFGYGKKALDLAKNLNTAGQQYFLVKKL